jgi:hypothetical protein
MRGRLAFAGIAVVLGVAASWAFLGAPEGDDPRGGAGARREESRVEPPLPAPPVLSTTPGAGGATGRSRSETTPPKAAGLEGVVRIGGAPGARLRVRAEPVGGGVSSPWVETTRDGAFRFEGLERDRRYRVLARTGPLADEVEAVASAAPGEAGIEGNLAGGPPVDRRDAAGGASAAPRRGRVAIVGHDGRRVARASVKLLMPSPLPGGPARTGFGGFLDVKDGEFVRSPWETWDWEYEVTSPVDERGEALPYGPARVRFEDDGAVPGTVVLPPERVVEGRLLTPEGLAVSGLELHAMRASPAAGSALLPDASATTGPDGSFRLRGLAPGAHVVWLSSPPPPPLLAPRDWTFGPEDARVEFRLEAGRAVAVRVVDREGMPVEQALVGWRPAAGPAAGVDAGSAGARGSSTDARGVATLVVPAGEVSGILVVTPPWKRTDLLPVEVPNWTPDDRPMVLDRGFVVSGVVRDGAGAASRGWVRRRESDGRFVPIAGVLPDGTFSISRLPAGPLTIAASRTPQGPLGPEQTVDAGTTGVALVVGPERK